MFFINTFIIPIIPISITSKTNIVNTFVMRVSQIGGRNSQIDGFIHNTTIIRIIIIFQQRHGLVIIVEIVICRYLLLQKYIEQNVSLNRFYQISNFIYLFFT